MPGGRQARNFTTNVPKILDLKSSSKQIFFRKLTSGAPDYYILNKQSLGLKARFKRMGVKNMPFHYKCRDLCGWGHWL